MRTLIMAATLVVAGVNTMPANANPEPIQAKDGKSYRHKPSKIDFPAAIADLPRRQMVAYSPDMLDVSAEYVDAEERNWISVYVYRNVSGNASVWFDRARTAILSLPDKYPGARSLGIRPFVPRGQSTASGLIDVFTIDGSLKATGLMVLPFNGFYAKVRISSETKSPAEIETVMLAVANAFDWRSSRVEDVAEPVRDCPQPLAMSATTKAIATSDDDRMMTALLGGVLAGAMVDKKGKEIERPAGKFCREPGSVRVDAAQYRFNQATDGYLVAIGDNGTAVSVGTDTLGVLFAASKENEQPAGFNVSVIKMDRTFTFPKIDSLPTIDALFEYLEKSQPLSSATTWGKGSSISISAP